MHVPDAATAISGQYHHHYGFRATFQVQHCSPHRHMSPQHGHAIAPHHQPGQPIILAPLCCFFLACCSGKRGAMASGCTASSCNASGLHRAVLGPRCAASCYLPYKLYRVGSGCHVVRPRKRVMENKASCSVSAVARTNSVRTVFAIPDIRSSPRDQICARPASSTGALRVALQAESAVPGNALQHRVQAPSSFCQRACHPS